MITITSKMADETTPITETPVETTPVVAEPTTSEIDPTVPAGVPEGTVLDTESGQEKVVHDLDENGNVIGWHKEVV